MEEDEPLFIDDIISSTHPPRFRMPPVTPYTGSGDPTEHLKSFRAWMELQSTFKPIMYCAFYLTLAGAMRSWYRQVKLKSINSFSDLNKAFLMQFIFEKERRKPSTHLRTIKQKEGEALKDYIVRFNEEAMQVDDYSDKMTLTAMIVGLREGRFLFSIGKNPPTTLGELMNNAQKYSNVEELFSSRKATRDVENSAKDKKRKEEAPSQAPSNKRRKDEKSIKIDIDKRDKRKYFHFNRDHSHSTSDYFDLKEEIEALIHSGHLREYVKEERSGRKDEQPIRTINNNPISEIHIIFGRPEGGGDSNRA
ncbi:uncharacterized protein LOC131224236 [Magnolia sinica]|uniref:uncharacterized protein LOC131224236 n=1 Tax=Magnolia sinica TaxID=86752 RepID=UPI00265841F8|nr:uncharacterized protein LOC131224236 [Magnolia sinica]